MKEKQLLRLNEIAKLAGVLPSTVRYYSNIGLIDVLKRSAGGHRLYGQDALSKLRQIIAIKKERITLIDMKNMIKAGDTGWQLKAKK